MWTKAHNQAEAKSKLLNKKEIVCPLKNQEMDSMKRIFQLLGQRSIVIKCSKMQWYQLNIRQSKKSQETKKLEVAGCNNRLILTWTTPWHKLYMSTKPPPKRSNSLTLKTLEIAMGQDLHLLINQIKTN